MLPGWRKEEGHQDPSDLCFVWACHLQHLVKLSSLKQFLPLMIHFFLYKKSSSLKSCQQYCILHLKPRFSALFSLGGSLPYWRNALRRFTLTIFGQPWLQVTSRVTMPVVFLVFLDTTLSGDGIALFPLSRPKRELILLCGGSFALLRCFILWSNKWKAFVGL